MSHFFRKKQKSILGLFLIAQLFVMSAIPASAGLFSGPKIPSASSIASDLEKRYHLDLGSVQEQGETFNVGDNKKPTPEASIFFNPSDPKVGEKLSAKAFPMYFGNKESSLYYTWYLKHVECELNNNPNATTRSICDQDGDDRITIEDWKIEAAKILAQNGFDSTRDIDEAAAADDDSYKARFGGDNKVATPDHCYVHDPVSGKNYELVDTDNVSFGCSGNTSPVCMVGEGQIVPEELDVQTDSSATGGTGTGGSGDVGSGTGGSGTGGSSSGSADATGATFSFSDTDVCHVAGLPTCSSNGTVVCGVGSPRCVADSTTTTSCGSVLSTCSSDNVAPTANLSSCKHLFPHAPGHKSGLPESGGALTYGADEEDFWGTNPKDPSTADNGNKDEANIVGLGQTTLTWNYVAGDQVGVAIEGVSMLPTKHADSSNMIMWAFSKNDCPIDGAKQGSYNKSIKGYDVNFPTVDFDLNSCIARNLVDPAQGGQSTNLEVGVSASPDNPINDETADKAGDIIAAQASVSNSARTLSEVFFEWTVQFSDNMQFRNEGAQDISDPVSTTSKLQELGLLGNIKGNALDSINLKLDIPNNTLIGGQNFSSYLSNGVGYVRFTAKASESFTSGITRRGKSDVIVKFTSTGRKISAHKAEPYFSDSSMHVKIPSSGSPICNGFLRPDGTMDTLDKASCRVIKNEIIGLSIDSSGLSNYQWVINGVPLSCTSAVSSDCNDDAQSSKNFFPISGNVGDTYTVTVTANDIATDKSVTLSRSFRVVEPELSIESGDTNAAWPKLLGQYRDISGRADVACPGGLCNDYSSSILQAFSGSTLILRARFIPNFLSSSAEREWTVDGTTVPETASGEISFTSDKIAPSIYNISLGALVVQSPEVRRALLDIWGISPLDSPEIRFSTSAQVEISDGGLAQEKGTRKYLAAVASYIPASILFSLRIILSVALAIFTAGVLFALMPERLAPSRGLSRRDE